MVRLFDIVNSKVVPSEHCYSLEALKAVMDEFPQDYLSIYAYIFYMTCPNPDLNPFFDVPEEDKEELIIREVGLGVSLEDPFIINAIELCKKLYQTPTYRAYLGIKIFLDRMGESLAKEQITFNGRNASADALLKYAERFNNVRESYKGIYRDLMEEQQSKTRGGQNLAYDTQ